jgi:transketolase
MLGWDLDGYVRRIEAFGWKAIAIDGHDVDAIEAAYAEAEATTGQPVAIVARPRRARASRRSRTSRQARQAARRSREAIAGARRRARPDGRRRRAEAARRTSSRRPAAAADVRARRRGGHPQGLRRGDRRARRIRGDVVALDGEVSNSTHSEDFRKAHPDRYFEMFIAEQQLVAARVGMQVRGWTPFVSTFAAFLSRAYDFVRMARSRARSCA